MPNAFMGSCVKILGGGVRGDFTCFYEFDK